MSAIGGALTEQLQVFSPAECLAIRTTCLKLAFYCKILQQISLSFATILERPSTPVEDLCERSALQLRARVQLVSKNNRAEFERAGARLPCLLFSPATPHQGGLLCSMISAFDRSGNCSEPGLQLPASTSSSDFKISTSPRHPESKNRVSIKALRKPSTLSLSDQTPPISLGTAAAAPARQKKLFSILDSQSQCASSSWKDTASAGVYTTNTL